MPGLLSQSQVTGYTQDGFVFPVPVLERPEVAALRGELESWERTRGMPIDFPEKSKSYLLFEWADRLVHPRIRPTVLHWGSSVRCRMRASSQRRR